MIVYGFLSLLLAFFTLNDPDISLEDTINVDGLKRTYLLDLPDEKNEKPPLLIVLHGGFGSGKQARDSYDLTPLANQHGYIVVYPDGIAREGRFEIKTWNAGNCCGNAAKSNVDDVKFISMLIDKMVKERSIDSDKVFVTGISNGAMLAYRLACEIPEKIRAIAPVAGFILPVEKCSSSVPIIHFHSRQDKNVPIEGGKGQGPSGYEFPALEEVISVWEDLNQCVDANRDTLRHGNYSLIRWRNCTTLMEYYLTEDGGHSWPGADSKPWRRADDPSKALYANKLMFDFFSQIQ